MSNVGEATNQCRAWLLLAYGDRRAYSGNVGYDDVPNRTYRYDSLVPNHKQLTVDDLVVLTTPDGAIGVGRVEHIHQRDGRKTLHRCPVCGIAQSKVRETKTPRFRCRKGHEFDEPKTDIVPCTEYEATFESTFVTLEGFFNGQMSIQPIDLVSLMPRIRAVSPEAAALIDAKQNIQVCHYWALLCNPRHYRIEDALNDLVEDLWAVSRGDVHAGDRVAIWKAAGDGNQRGIVALGTVLTDPVDIAEPECLQEYWRSGKREKDPARSVWVRYVRSNRLPLWLHEDRTGLLADLSVSRATGGTVFKISHNQWERLEQLAGGWPRFVDESVDVDEAAEGRIQLRLHKIRERNPRLVKRKKEIVFREKGCLKCEVCGFDFSVAYAGIADGFIECHHGIPISRMEPGETTRIEDLHLVCANCHRVLHLGKDTRSVDDLRHLVAREREKYCVKRPEQCAVNLAGADGPAEGR